MKIIRKSVIFVLLSIVLSASLAHAANPIIGSWRIADMPKSGSAQVRLLGKDKSVIAVVRREQVRRLAEIVSKMSAALSIDTEFFLIQYQDRSPNAGALKKNDKNLVAVTASMLDLLGDDYDAFAAIVGHELAHLVKDHGAGRQARTALLQGLGAVLGAVVGARTGFNPQSIFNLGGDLLNRSFSRDDEREADALGIGYMVQTGYDPTGGVRAHERLMSARKTTPSPFFSTHPLSEERIANIREVIAKLPEEQRNALVRRGDPLSAAQTVAVGNPHVVTIAYRGSIKSADIERLKLAAAKVTGDPLPGGLIVLLDSGGGDAMAAIELGRLIRRYNAHVFVTGRCAGACVYFLAGGVTRVAPDGKIGIFRGKVTRPGPDGTTTDVTEEVDPKAEEYRASFEDRILDYLREMGIPTGFFEAVRSSPPHPSIRWLTIDEAAALGITGYDTNYVAKRVADVPQLSGVTLTEYGDRTATAYEKCKDHFSVHSAFVHCYRAQLTAPVVRAVTAEQDAPKPRPVVVRGKAEADQQADKATAVPDIETAQRLVMGDPSNARLWRDLARQYEAAEQTENAVRAYAEALRLEPGDADALEAVGALYAKLGNKEKVRETWQALAGADKERAQTFFATYVLP